MNQNDWLALIICRQKKSEKLKFAKTGLFGQYPAAVFCLL